MEKNIIVKRSEILAGAKGEYLRVYYDEGGKEKFQNVFDQALWNLFGDGLGVRLHLEKEGTWFNVKNAEAIEKPAEPPQEKSPQQGITKHEPAPQELGMWWKELGEMLRAKDINLTTPEGKLLRTAYYAQMLSVLEIKIEKKEP